MRDQRLQVFRGALEGLIESLDALVRVTRWSDTTEAPPAPLRAAAAKVAERLGVADRLASGRFVGSPADTRFVEAICAKMKRLDVAYVAYRKRLEREPDERGDAAAALETDIAEAVGTAPAGA
jgi:hypothetical protein